MADFSDQIAVITGAGSGIGRAIARGLQQVGAIVCLVGRNLAALEAVRDSDSAHEARVNCYQADLSRDEDLLELAGRLKRDFQGIDLLVHSAGAFSYGPLETAPVANLDIQYRINVRAPYALTQALLPQLKARQGQIVFINSSVSLRNAEPNLSQYTATKNGLRAIADSLRSEVNPQGLRVLSVYPGRTASPMQAVVHQFQGKAYDPEGLMQPEDVAVAVINAITLPRSAEVTDISLRPMKR